VESFRETGDYRPPEALHGTVKPPATQSGGHLDTVARRGLD